MTESYIYGHAAVLSERVEQYCKDNHMGPRDGVQILLAAAAATGILHQRDPLGDNTEEYMKLAREIYDHLYRCHLQDLREQGDKGATH